MEIVFIIVALVAGCGIGYLMLRYVATSQYKKRQSTMAEASEFFLIQLRIDNQTYPVNIRRDQEEIYREAERQINDKLNLYKDRFPNLAKEQYLYMTLLDLSVRLIQSERRNDTEPYESVMNNLTAEILATLGDKS